MNEEKRPIIINPGPILVNLFFGVIYSKLFYLGFTYVILNSPPFDKYYQWYSSSMKDISFFYFWLLFAVTTLIIFNIKGYQIVKKHNPTCSRLRYFLSVCTWSLVPMLLGCGRILIKAMI